MGRLDGRIAIVTGATDPTGRSVAARLAAEGAFVVATGDGDGAATVAAVEAAGGRGTFRRHDAADPAGWPDLVAEVERQHGGVDVLVTSAAATLRAGLLDTTEDELDRLYRSHVEGAFLAMQAVLPAMDRRGGGSIVNVCSVLGLRGEAGATAYCAVMGALTQLSRSVSLEAAAGGRGIRVNVIHAGVPAPAERVAGAAAYLASDEARLVTGSEITIDGGRVAA